MDSAKKPMVSAGGGTAQSNTPAVPGVMQGPVSPGEAPNLMLTPDCPKTEADIKVMQKQ